jgi:hypothetical protein
LDIYKCPKTTFPFGFPGKKRKNSLVTEMVSFHFLKIQVVTVNFLCFFKKTEQKTGHFSKMEIFGNIKVAKSSKK